MLSLYVLYLVGLLFCYSSIVTHLYSVTHQRKLQFTVLINILRPNVLHLTYISTHILVQPPPPHGIHKCAHSQVRYMVCFFQTAKILHFFRISKFFGRFLHRKMQNRMFIDRIQRTPHSERKAPLWRLSTISHACARERTEAQLTESRCPPPYIPVYS